MRSPDSFGPVLHELVGLSQRLGAPQHDLAILAEGNASAALGDGTFLIKASGARLHTATSDDFVHLHLRPLLDAIRDSARMEASDLFAAALDGDDSDLPPSIETFVHVAAIGVAKARWVAHTHPVALTGLLCTREGSRALAAGPLFPDEVVLCGGMPLLVPYAEPGLELGRSVARLLESYIERSGVPPRIILLENHGLVALGSSAAEAEATTLMAAKAARIRAIALAAGGLRPLGEDSVAELAGRGDEAARRARLLLEPR